CAKCPRPHSHSHPSGPSPHPHSFPTRRSSDLIHAIILCRSYANISAWGQRIPLRLDLCPGGYLAQSGNIRIGTNTKLFMEPDCSSEEHTSELQSRFDLVCRLRPEKKKRRKQRL